MVEMFDDDDDVLLLVDVVGDDELLVEAGPPFPFEREVEELARLTAELDERGRQVVLRLRRDLQGLRADWPTFSQEVMRSGNCIVAAARAAARATKAKDSADAAFA